jgi:hypothetical protein
VTLRSSTVSAWETDMPSLVVIAAEDARKLPERETLIRIVCLYISPPAAVTVVKGPRLLPS